MAGLRVKGEFQSVSARPCEIAINGTSTTELTYSTIFARSFLSCFVENAPRFIRTLNKMKCPVDETLFIMVVKSPYSWLASMAERKYVQTGGLNKRHLKQFVKSKWTGASFADNEVRGEKEFANVMRMRSDKLRSHLKVKGEVKHFEMVKYEDFINGECGGAEGLPA